MRWQALGNRMVFLLVALAVALGGWTTASAQFGSTAAGVVVDAQGVLQKRVFTDPGGRLMQERIAAAKASLKPQLAKFSQLRKISLNRLEEAISGRQNVPTDEMRCLAGLLRVQYVFYYPDSDDIVIAGPAEGWATNAAGRMVGMTSGRPVIQLQDLAVALRAFPPGKRGTQIIGCSIDPTQEGLAAMQQFLRSMGSRAVPGQTQYIVDGLLTSLGLQKVSINGISPNTHFAQVLVEADYRMKLIGIGLEKPPVKLVSYVDRANPAQVSRNAMQRWFFTPDYNCVRVSEDGLAMELVGDGVKLIGENELVTATGQRKAAARGSRASQAFVASFTKKYSELAERSPVYAELRNLIDLAVAAAFIQQEDYYGQSGWKMELLGDEQTFSVETYNAPTQVASAATARWKGNRLMTPIGGGVEIRAAKALDDSNQLADEKGKVAELHKQTTPKLAKGQWWWD